MDDDVGVDVLVVRSRVALMGPLMLLIDSLMLEKKAINLFNFFIEKSIIEWSLLHVD